ncbi:MAG: RNA recognition motif domain-containing protein [Nitrospiraceae bacterium]
MRCTLFVDGLRSIDVPEHVRALFEPFGVVTDARVITLGMDSRFGYVTMGSETEARAAILQLNGRSVQGRRLRVSWSLLIDPDGDTPKTAA